MVSLQDHVVKDVEQFSKLVLDSANLADSGKIVTFGIVPNKPSTGYGYIEKGDDLHVGYEVKKDLLKKKTSFI